MTNFQKIIKAFAITLSIIIIINIFSLITYGISLLTNLNITKSFTQTDNTTFEETYQNIRKLEIDIKKSNIKLIKGNKFKVTTYDLEKNFHSYKRKETLVIKENNGILSKNNNSLIIIEIPNDTKLEELDIDTGAGFIEIEEIYVNEAEINHGAGSLTIIDSNFKEIDIDGGAGEITIETSILNNLELDAGIGKIEIESEITGNSKISCGIGEINITLKGSENNYKLITEKGLGEIKINDKKQTNSNTYGTGTNKIELEGGIGNINVFFN